MTEKLCQAQSARKSKVRASEHARLELLLLAMARDRERDEPFDERLIVDAARGPQLRVHADRREAGQGVDLVEIELTGRFGSAGNRRGRGRCRRSPGTRGSPDARPRPACGASSTAGISSREPLVDVLRFVVVELPRRHDLAGDRGLRVVVADHGALDLARVRHGQLDDDLAVVVGGQRDRRARARRARGPWRCRRSTRGSPA